MYFEKTNGLKALKKNEIGSLVVENEPPKVGEISGKSSYKKCKEIIGFLRVKKITMYSSNAI